MNKYRFLLLAPLLLIGACSSGDEQTTPEQSSEDHFLKEQMRALEKAKEVEKMLQSGADQRRQAMEEQSL